MGEAEVLLRVRGLEGEKGTQEAVNVDREAVSLQVPHVLRPVVPHQREGGGRRPAEAGEGGRWGGHRHGGDSGRWGDASVYDARWAADQKSGEGELGGGLR